MSTETDFLCAAVNIHAKGVRALLAEINAAKFDSPAWVNAVCGLIARAEHLANRAEELAELCKERKAP